MTETFSPSVLIDGIDVHPEGWMYVLAFALKGIPWAVKECEKPNFDLRGKLATYYNRQKEYVLRERIEDYEKKLDKIKSELKVVMKDIENLKKGIDE